MGRIPLTGLLGGFDHRSTRDQTSGVRIRKLLVAPAGLLILSVLAPAVVDNVPGAGAATPATDAAGLVYPLTSFLDWAQNPVSNLTNPALGA
ncbi:MAG: hypothetical protein ACRDWB_06080, partial [Acidimicrobiales bacterium]